MWELAGLLCTIDGMNHTMLWFLVMLTSILQGFGLAIYYVAQGKYLSICIRSNPTKQGLYSSIFWATFFLACIGAYTVDALLLGHDKETLLFSMSIGFTIVGMIILQFLPHIDKSD